MVRPVSDERLKQLATITPTFGLNAESAEELRAIAAELLQLRADIADERARLRREQDARAALRVELDRARLRPPSRRGAGRR